MLRGELWGQKRTIGKMRWSVEDHTATVWIVGFFVDLITLWELLEAEQLSERCWLGFLGRLFGKISSTVFISLLDF